MNQLLTTSQVAKMLQVSPEWVRSHASGKRRPIIPAVRINGGLKTIYRFDEAIIMEWIKELMK